MSSSVSEKLLEVRDYTKEGYSPVVDYDAWRVAVLNYSNDLLFENITAMQRHNETDEVFVLLRGRCILFIGEGEEKVTDIFAENMQQFILDTKTFSMIPMQKYEFGRLGNKLM